MEKIEIVRQSIAQVPEHAKTAFIYAALMELLAESGEKTGIPKIGPFKMRTLSE